MILIIDNYDSFVYNLARYVSELGVAAKVLRNDAITLEDIASLAPAGIIISPGPCDPTSAGISMQAISQFGADIPILGVCLGHQAIGQVYGGEVVKAKRPMHGMASRVTHHGESIFKDIESPLKVGRYHSLIVKKESLPECLKITSESEEGEIMALEHKHYPVYGVQFHPESILTEQGYQILKNYIYHNKIA